MSANIYYDPEKFGLEIVGEVEFSSGSYEFDTSVLWRDNAAGSFFVADDAGCSCPSPFESTGRNDLKPITKLGDLLGYLDQRKKASYYYGDWGDKAGIDAECVALVQKYQEARS